MQRAADVLAPEKTLRQSKSGVRAEVTGGENLVLDSVQDEILLLDANGEHAVGGNLRQRGDSDEILHQQFDGSTLADIDPLQRGMRGSAPKAWIWSRLNSACSRLPVKTLQRPVASTSAAIRNAVSRLWPKIRPSMSITYS